MKKAQIKMFETVGVLVVFFFLLAAGAAFYFGAQKSSLQKEIALSNEKFAFQTSQKIFHLPELDCSFLTTRKENCIDKIKAKDFANMLRNEDVLVDYFGDFGFSSVKVRQAWPSGDPEFIAGFTIYDNPMPDYNDKIVSITPALLFDPWLDQYSFGIIEVAVYA